MMLWLSILPAAITILFAITTRKILPSLMIGLLCGGFLRSNGSFSGVEITVDYIIENLAQKSNLYVLVFLFLFSAFVMLIRRSGGVKAFTSIMERFIHEKQGVFYALWGLLPVTFIDCGFRVVATGSILRPIAEKQSISRERFAFMLNNTASPFVELIPIATTFVAYNIGVIQQSLQAAGIQDQSAYSILLHSIPLQFFSLAVLPLTFGFIYWKRKDSDAASNRKENKSQEIDMDMSMGKKEPEIKPRIMNLIVPLFLVIGLSLGLLTISGFQKAQETSNLTTIINAMEPGKTMLVALFISLILSSIFYLIQGYKLKKMTSDLIEGGNGIMQTLAILVLAWPLSKISQDLGLADLVQQTLGGTVSSSLIAVAAFITTSLVTYFIGSSWGAKALMMPVMVPLAASSGASIALVVAAVISGGSYGDVTSPVSGMTNMAANVAKADHSEYVKQAFRYNTFAAVIAAVLFLVIPMLW